MKQEKTKIPQESTLSIIRKLRSGEIRTSNLTLGQRQDCVELLSLEGYTTAQIADLLHKSDRTIKRYKAKIRKQNAISSTPQFVKEQIGKYLLSTDSRISHLVRIAQDPNTPVKEKIAANKAILEAEEKIFKRLQSAGYLRHAYKKGFTGYEKEQSDEKMKRLFPEGPTYDIDLDLLQDAVQNRLQREDADE